MHLMGETSMPGTQTHADSMEPSACLGQEERPRGTREAKMMVTRIKVQSLVVSLLLLLFVVVGSHADTDHSADNKRAVPSIWANGDESYLLRAEIDLLDTGKTLFVEEWASARLRAFRLDVFDYTNGSRRTILAHEKTGERFQYEPFTCSLVNDFKSEALRPPEFAGIFPQTAPSPSPRVQVDNYEAGGGDVGMFVVPTGIGSLWVHAMQLDAVYSRPSTEPLHSNMESANGKANKMTAERVFARLDRFTVPPTESYPFWLDLYFGQDSDRLVEIRLSTPPTTTNGGEERQVRARVKMLKREIPWKPAEAREAEDVFDLPVGYGCRRSPEFDHPYASPIDALGSRLVPHILQLDILTLRPPSSATGGKANDGDGGGGGDFAGWKTHSSTVRMVAGRLNLASHDDDDNNNNNDQTASSDFLALETQDYAPEFSSPKVDGGNTVRRATLRRLKQVWNLGPDGLALRWVAAANTATTTNDESRREPAMYFELDERRGECLAYGESGLDASASIEFPISSSPMSDESAAVGATADDQEAPAAGLSLNTELLDSLFAAADDYHLIKESEAPTRDSREFVYERRVSRFEMKNKLGELIWSGPASLVRRHSLYYPDRTRARPRNRRGPPRRQATDDDDQRASVTLYLLSKRLDRIVTRIQLSLVEKRPVHESYFHRELDVGPCFERISRGWTREGKGGVSSRLLSSTTTILRDIKMAGLEFALHYPIDLASGKDVAEQLATGPQVEASIYEQFLRSMYAVSGRRLDPLQLVNVDIDFGTDLLKISAKLLQVPSLLSYRELKGHRFSRTKRSLYHTHLKSDAQSCAESCDHYNCTMFAFCPQTRSCDIAMRAAVAGASAAASSSRSLVENAAAATDCSVFETRARGRRLGIEPRQLVHNLRSAIASSSAATEEVDDDEGETNKLLVALEYRTANGLVLATKVAPSLVESGLFSADDFDDLVTTAETAPKQQSGRPPARVELSASGIGEAGFGGQGSGWTRSEYALVAEHLTFRRSTSGRQTKSDELLFPIAPAEHTSYEDCEALCDETDCRSFSHCQLEQVCTVSQLHKSKLIMKHLVEGHFCFVMARDYLSKFQPPVWVPPAGKRAVSAKAAKQGKWLRVAEGDGGSGDRECANSCMEERAFKCRAFYYCPAAGKMNCYLSGTHTVQALSKARQQPTARASQTTSGCQFYARSFLVEFDKFHGKSLPEMAAAGTTNQVDDNDDDEGVSGDGSRILVMRGGDAELCAAKCAEQAGSCRAFEVCRHDVAHHEPTCALLLLRPPSNKQPTTSHSSPLSTRQLIAALADSERCTSFVVAPESELNGLQWRNGTSGGSDLVEDILPELALSAADRARLSPSTGGHLMARVALLFLGAAMGYMAVFVYRARFARPLGV